jgi:hypothetical protein
VVVVGGGMLLHVRGPQGGLRAIGPTTPGSLGRHRWRIGSRRSSPGRAEEQKGHRSVAAACDLSQLLYLLVFHRVHGSTLPDVRTSGSSTLGLCIHGTP